MPLAFDIGYFLIDLYLRFRITKLGKPILSIISYTAQPSWSQWSEWYQILFCAYRKFGRAFTHRLDVTSISSHPSYANIFVYCSSPIILVRVRYCLKTYFSLYSLPSQPWTRVLFSKWGRFFLFFLCSKFILRSQTIYTQFFLQSQLVNRFVARYLQPVCVRTQSFFTLKKAFQQS